MTTMIAISPKWSSDGFHNLNIKYFQPLSSMTHPKSSAVVLVDPRVCAAVETGQQHDDDKHWTCKDRRDHLCQNIKASQLKLRSAYVRMYLLFEEGLVMRIAY